MKQEFAIPPSSVLGSVTNLAISAGTLSSNRSDVTFADSNGISFGLNTNGVITASGGGGGGGGAGTGFTTATTAGTNVVGTLSTNGLSMGVPAFLTTADLSQNSSKYAGTGFTTATTAGTNIVGTLNTAGISMGVPAYLTTAMQSNAATISNINVSAGTTSNNLSAITFSNSNNVSFGLNGSTLTVSIATTYAGTGFTTATTAGTAIVGTLNTSGLSMGVPAYLTTAMQSNAATISNINVSAGTTSTNASAFTFANANNVSFGLGTGASAGSITGSIATTYAGTGFTSTTTAGTAIVGTLNTSGLSLGVPAYLTTADLSQNSSNYAGTNGAITGGSITVNTSGVSVNVPIATISLFDSLGPMQGTTVTAVGVSRLDIIPFMLPQPISAGFIRFFGSMSPIGASGTGTSANTSFTINRSYTTAIAIYSQGTGANSLSLRYSTSTLASWVFQTSLSAGAVGSQYTITFNITYPTQGTTSAYTTSYATSDTQYDISTGTLTLFTGAKYMDVPFAQSMSPGNYWLGIGNSTNTGTQGGVPSTLSGASVGFSYLAMTQATTVYGFPGVATNLSNQVIPGLGSWSTNSAIMSTSSIGLASVSFNTVANIRIPFQFIRQA